jgi:D-beta-D-heptose 7-phosphate kinase/D-beta-D-heptose 1-phosphate adenosyltransferase
MFTAIETVRRAIEGRFGGRRVMVVGDLMLDMHLWGDVNRISPEAPVPVIRLSRRTETAGGAGNVLLNLAALGIQATAAGFVGDDEAGRRLLGRLDDAGVATGAVVRWTGQPTIVKTRVIGGHQQMLRIDEEPTTPPAAADHDRLWEQIRVGFENGGFDAVILSDYLKGALSPALCQFLITEARRRAIPILVDPKGRDFRKYARATTLKPNRHEFDAAIGPGDSAETTFPDAGQRLRKELELDFLVVTEGERGMSLIDDRGLTSFPAHAREVFDVSGAGDTVIAALAAGMVAGLTVDDSLALANVAAGVVVGKVGTVPIQLDELNAALRAEETASHLHKICTLDTLLKRVAQWRARGERIVFTNGCFDLLHVGHVTLLARAQREGTRLIVGLNTDRSVRALKGESRPVVTQDDRAQMLASLTSVDAVSLFDEETPLRLIEAIRPEVLVKGGDYSETQVVGADLVRSWGGKLVLVPLVEGRSTTRLLSGR